MSGPRQYDIILLGATGYTGKLTAEYITQTFPTNLKWAIAGRSESKLKDVNKTLRALNSSRDTPDVQTVNLSLPELKELAKKTKIILNTVGPFHRYSTPVVQACAETGTHYLDVTGETPWVYEIIKNFEATAKRTGAILIPEIGVESAPSDMIAYVATRLVRQVWDCGVSDVIASMHELKSSGPSGGTLATAIGLLDHYSISTVRKTLGDPFCLSPIKERDHKLSKNPTPSTYSRSIFQRLTGVWSYPYLGTLSTSITGSTNNALVNRSAGLKPLFYGFNFTYEEYMRASNFFTGFFVHIVLIVASMLLIVPPFRKLALARVTQPGFGPSKESSKNDRLEMRCVAVAEQLAKTQRKAVATLTYDGSMYAMTAVTLAEGGRALLEGENEIRDRFGKGGFFTPACLGDRYVEGLERGGVKFQVKQVGDSGSK